MFRIVTIIIITFSASYVNANCDFKTGAYIDQLKDTANIKNIEITVPKSKKYTKNILKILASDKKNIPPNLKKKFKAEISINYLFGKCKFKGEVRQNGDQKDHLALLPGGGAYRSLKVSLDEGNIISAVQFKLLVPKSRNGVNEILTSLILKNLEVLSPETFAVKVTVNGVTATLLYQEAARKELLERNGRREGPIFEGDEELLWSFKDFRKLELTNLSLSRIINKNWFNKGQSSQVISLAAYSHLQSAYFDYAMNVDERLQILMYPNKNRYSEFSRYLFALLAMGGEHALWGYNRKFYYNSLMERFEPIYYDGNTFFGKLNSSARSRAGMILSKQLNNGINVQFVEKIKTVLNSKLLKDEFIDRSEALNYGQLLKTDFDELFEDYKKNYLHNIEVLFEIVSKKADIVKGQPQKKQLISDYVDAQDEVNVKQKIITTLTQEKDGYLAEFYGDAKQILSVNEVLNIIARNRLNGERTLFLGDFLSKSYAVEPIKVSEVFAENISMSRNMKMEVLGDKKIVIFTQLKMDDWAVIKSGDLSDWKVIFNGVDSTNSNSKLSAQRFNEYSLTGCMSFYDTDFENTTIEVNGGMCEDSINIINSVGSIEKISVKSAFADALDIDFSNLIVKKINIDIAGNDCVDVSSGIYRFGDLTLNSCGDKGISVGERSQLFADLATVIKSNIGISSKDLSKVEIAKLNAVKSHVCVEAKQKKQEFGGSYLFVKDLKCNGASDVDNASIFLRTKNEL